MAEVLLLVNGIPASGKTALARPLARRLGLPLLAKDIVKESLFDSLGVKDREWSRRLGGASARVIWAIVPHLPGAVLLETNAGPQIADLFTTEARAAGVQRIVQVWCEVPAETAYERFLARASSDRHPGHCDDTGWNTLETLRSQNEPLDLGPLLRVPTDRPVDLDAVTAWVRGHLRPLPT